VRVRAAKRWPGAVEDLALAPETWRRGRHRRVVAPRQWAMLDLLSARQRRLSCGIVVLLESRELLLCHVTGQRHWDLPKGGLHDGETPVEAALRETHEETGLRLRADALLDLGPHDYTAKKGLHLFACLSERIDPRELHCASCFVERFSGRPRPEMDGFGWFAFDRIESLCTPRLAALLSGAIDLDAVLAQLGPGRAQALAA
jgi:putative (di)nucleoside polyphosphate hydrolase